MDVFSDNFKSILSDAVKSVTAQVWERIERKTDIMVDLRSKEFWSTKELVERGWSSKIVDDFVVEGKLTRINAGGSAGFKYATVQLLTILENYDSCTASTLLPRRK
jgi:hypothetical protein